MARKSTAQLKKIWGAEKYVTELRKVSEFALKTFGRPPAMDELEEFRQENGEDAVALYGAWLSEPAEQKL